MATKTRVRTHHYLHDRETGRCKAPGLHGTVCGLPEKNAHHDVTVDQAAVTEHQRRTGDHHE